MGDHLPPPLSLQSAHTLLLASYQNKWAQNTPHRKFPHDRDEVIKAEITAYTEPTRADGITHTHTQQKDSPIFGLGKQFGCPV